MDQILSLLTVDLLDKPAWMWGTFLSLVLILLVLDLGVFNRKNHEIEIKESLYMSAFYISIGLLFGGWIWWELGQQNAIDYWTGFVVEKTLAMDNIFVIAMLFAYFKIPRLYQHRVLFWGILGVIILRGIMIGVGAALLHEFEWLLYVFSAFLVFTGVKMLFSSEEDEPHIGENFVLRMMRKYCRTTDDLHGDKFFIRQHSEKAGKVVTYLTPLFVALVMIEIADVIFAVDSIPAIFAITLDPFIVYTSNIFAILGLRALYFALAAMLNRFIYLQYSLSLVLIFIGAKMFIIDIFNIEHFPPLLSLGITVGILIGGVGLSLWKTRSEVTQTNP
ncbi:MAG: TerC family protein [Micavibrio sp.]|nr:TerC family protein [Micavibrio sp.]